MECRQCFGFFEQFTTLLGVIASVIGSVIGRVDDWEIEIADKQGNVCVVDKERSFTCSMTDTKKTIIPEFHK